jgi:uncharacterized protein (DUF305 family)
MKWTLGTLLSLPVFAACGGRSASSGPIAAAPSPVTATESGPLVLPIKVGPSSTAAIAQAQADSVRYPYTAADLHFMAGMISHHAQAIAMARWAPSHGASPSVRTLCERIINAQTDEIINLQRWLADRRQPIPEPDPNGMLMAMGGMDHRMLMPGMLSEAQMKQLDAARGTEFDRLFLIFMIQHHQGALAMVQELFGSYGAAQDLLVFKFASDANIDQTTEITRMEKLLGALLLTSPQ